MPDAAGDGSIEMLQAFCHSILTGRQPDHVLEEAYYGSILCLLGDEAILQQKTLSFPEHLKI